MLVGAITASVANIAAGYLGDKWLMRHHSRRGLIAIGLVLLIFSFLPLALATGTTSLIIAIVIFQTALNLSLSPTMAVLSDQIPFDRKGAIAGLIGAALPLSALGTSVLGLAFPIDTNMAFFAAAVFVLICAAPLLVCWGFPPVGKPDNSPDLGMRSRLPTDFRGLALLWIARLAVQMSATFLLYYLFLHVVGQIAQNTAWRDESASDIISIISLLGAGIAVPAAIIAGKLSDQLAARKTVMIGAALLISFSFTLLGNNPAPLIFGTAFILFHAGLAVYLSVDTALVAQLVSQHPQRGKTLGIMNLANTVPAILVPFVTLEFTRLVGREVPHNVIYTASAIGLFGVVAALYRYRNI